MQMACHAGRPECAIMRRPPTNTIPALAANAHKKAAPKGRCEKAACATLLGLGGWRPRGWLQTAAHQPTLRRLPGNAFNNRKSGSTVPTTTVTPMVAVAVSVPITAAVVSRWRCVVNGAWGCVIHRWGWGVVNGAWRRVISGWRHINRRWRIAIAIAGPDHDAGNANTYRPIDVTGLCRASANKQGQRHTRRGGQG